VVNLSLERRMAKKTLADLPDLHGKRVLVRVDFNVPLDKAGNVTNDRRIRAALPTLKTLLDCGAALVVMSHLGRPTRKVDEVVGPQATAAAQALKPGDVLVLENLRFHPGEQQKDKALGAEL